MNTLKLTKSDFKETDNYWKEYIGTIDVSDYDGNIEIEENLWYVRFDSIKAKGSIIALVGSGIEAGDGIEAGWGIKAGNGIEAGLEIKAGLGIKAGWGIEAGNGIKAGNGIEAGLGIKAGWGIEAGDGIEAGLTISCKLTLSSNLRIFAWLAIWKNPEESETKIICGKLEKGKVCYGILEETGLPQETKEKFVEIDGKKYKLIEV